MTTTLELFKQAYQSRPKPVVAAEPVVVPTVPVKPLEVVTEPLSYRQALGQVLRSARKDKKLTLKQVSAKSYIAYGYISEIERGEKECSSCYLEWLTEALDLSLPDVLRCTAQLLEGK